MDENILTIQEFLKKYKGNPWDVCTYFYLTYIKTYIKEENDDVALNNLICFLKDVGNSDKSFVVSEKYSKDQYQLYLDEVVNFTNNIVNNLVKSNPNEREFYLSLLEKINDDTIFESDIKKGLAIMYLKTNVKIPYFQLDEGLKLEEDDYRKIINDNLETVQKALFIVNSGLEQNTEIASLLLKLIKEQENDEVKTVVLANVLSFFNYRFQTLTSIMDEKNKNNEENK